MIIAMLVVLSVAIGLIEGRIALSREEHPRGDATAETERSGVIGLAALMFDTTLAFLEGGWTSSLTLKTRAGHCLALLYAFVRDAQPSNRFNLHL